MMIYTMMIYTSPFGEHAYDDQPVLIQAVMKALWDRRLARSDGLRLGRRDCRLGRG